ncbi:MAG: ThiF family adenylyltransferase [Polaromonas sp.]|uniref:ThiF family adenylyltransferase n=1 Tax=Polaromonas sp. TaxID=1869339 RepID=UPI0024879F3D|nr:ThiF family adenylyltransferase [Polaromonas sp.]MDI1236392.1 ThiF family adenylyltransferase [Polaromonas sp.]
MSSALISRSPDLQRLQHEGYELEICSNHLLVHNVPYVTPRGEVARATLISNLSLAGDKTIKPEPHIAWFTGEHPCNVNGSEIVQIKHSSGNIPLAPDLVAKHSFSNKPPGGYADYYEKMTRYIEIISAPAQSLQPGVTACTFKVVASPPDDGVFNYMDTASGRVGITAVTAKLTMRKVAIVGVGGTGSYVLDLLAKTPIWEIHLYDSDKFLQHNAFRAPSAASLEELLEQPTKVSYFQAQYSRMHRGIKAHPVKIGPDNVAELTDFNFVFLCMDSGPAKKLIVETLQANGIPFVDVGMGTDLLEDSLELWAICRVTTSTSEKQDHISQRVSFAEADEDDYDRNIQIADLNALCAALAVIKWKKFCGFYQDLEHEHDSTYTTSTELLTSEDCA